VFLSFLIAFFFLMSHDPGVPLRSLHQENPPPDDPDSLLPLRIFLHACSRDIYLAFCPSYSPLISSGELSSTVLISLALQLFSVQASSFSHILENVGFGAHDFNRPRPGKTCFSFFLSIPFYFVVVKYFGCARLSL